MEIKYQCGGVHITYEAEMADFFKKENLVEMMFSMPNISDVVFSKEDLACFSKLYQSLPDEVAQYCINVDQLEKLVKVKVPKEEVEPNNPDIYPANGHDIYNYVARYGLADFQIQAVLRFDGFLDFKTLCNAVRLSVEAQPVFGSRFVENEPPYWKRRDDLDEVEFCTLEKTFYLDQAIQSFLDSPLDMDRDPMIKLKLIRWGDFDTLCIKLNHSCCDGTGVKEYIALLSHIYSVISEKYGIYIPKPARRSRKEQDRLFGELGIEDPEAVWIPGSEVTTATWPFPWQQSEPATGRMVVHRFPKWQLEEMIRFSKGKDATVNDLILATYYRAMSQMGTPNYEELMEIPVTIDLRRYLPDHKTDSIRNFSGSEFSRMALVPGETYLETLLRVVPMMKAIKESRPALQSAIGLERVENLTLSETLAYYKTVSQWSYYSGNKCAPVLSNLGVISNHEIKFGLQTVTDAYIAPPVVRPPGLLLMASTYNGILTLGAGYYDGTVKRAEIERLLELMQTELARECSPS